MSTEEFLIFVDKCRKLGAVSVSAGSMSVEFGPDPFVKTPEKLLYEAEGFGSQEEADLEWSVG